MKTNKTSEQNDSNRKPHNVALGIYTILTTSFIAGYTMIQLFAMH